MATKINNDGVKTRLLEFRFLFLIPLNKMGYVDGAACTYCKSPGCHFDKENTKI